MTSVQNISSGLRRSKYSIPVSDIIAGLETSSRPTRRTDTLQFIQESRRERGRHFTTIATGG